MKKINYLFMLSLAFTSISFATPQNIKAADKVDIVIQSTPTRPSKIWVTAEREYSNTPKVTIQHQVNSYGTIYKGPLSLKKGYYNGGIAKYEGYVYDTSVGVWPTKDKTKEK